MSTPILAKASPANTGRIQQIQQGQPAPFDGVIYDNQAHALLVAKTKAFQAKLELELDFLKQKMTLQCREQTRSLQVDLVAAQKKLELETQARQEQSRFLLGELGRARTTPWYRGPIFVYALGFLTCAVVTGLSVWGLRSLEK